MKHPFLNKFKINLLFLFILIFLNDNSHCQNIKSPSGGIVLSDTTVIFTWNFPDSAEYFHFQLASDSNFTSLMIDSNQIYNNQLLLFLGYNKYYWRLSFYNGTTFSSWEADSFIVFSPQNVSTLIAWFDAQYGIIKDTIGRISYWSDRSGNSHPLLQSDTSYQPLYVKSDLINDSVVSFDGLTQAIKTNPFSLEQPYTIMYLFDNKNQLPNNLYISDGNNVSTSRFEINNNQFLLYSGNYFSSISPASNNFNCTVIVYDSINTTIRNNFQYLNTGYPGDNNPNGFTLGTYGLIANNASVHAQLDCMEVLIFDSLLTDSMLYLCEKYLHDKYAPPVNLGVDKKLTYSLCPISLDAGNHYITYSWSTGDTTQSIVTDTSGYYAVTVTDIFNSQSSDSVYVEFLVPWQLNDSSICYNDTLRWHTAFDTTYSFLWNTGDTLPYIDITQQNNYFVQITDSFGCKFYSDTVFIKVDSFPALASLGQDMSLCAGQNITLQTGGNGAVDFIWSTGDTSEYITINTPNDYAVTVTDTIGCIAADTVQIDIHGLAPNANFTFSNVCFNDTTFFTDSSYVLDSSNIISWQWQFPDTTFTTQNTQYLFLDTGNYNIILTVATDSNCINISSQTINIHSLPQVNFSLGLNCDHSDIPFTNLTISSDSIQTYLWNFGDGTYDTLTNTSHIYTQSGNYNISLHAISTYGCMDSISKNIEIKPSPSVNFSYANTCSNQSTIFNNLTTTSSPIFTIIDWLWDFGDGTTSENINPLHNFNTAGDYPISLYAKCINGCSQTQYDTIRIYQSPTAAYTHDSIICENTTQQFIDVSQITNDSIVSWNWSIEGSLQSTEQNPFFYFSESGNQNIILTVNTAHQCFDDYSENVFVYPSPITNFTYYPEVGTTTTEITYSTDSGYTYFWDFGDSYTSTNQNPNHFYTDTGTYEIQLFVTNDYGCTDTIQKSIMIVSPFYDIAIYQFNFTLTNSYLTFSCQFLNAGPLPIDSLTLTLQISNATNFTESWSGHLLSGELNTYVFSTYVPVIDNKIPDYICLQIDIPEQSDATPENNLKCIDTDNNFILYSVYPNPVENNLYVEFNLDETVWLSFQIYDKLGKTILSESLNNLNKGFNRIKVNTSNLSSGTYTIRILKKTDSIEGQFMVK